MNRKICPLLSIGFERYMGVTKDTNSDEHLEEKI